MSQAEILHLRNIRVLNTDADMRALWQSCIPNWGNFNNVSLSYRKVGDAVPPASSPTTPSVRRQKSALRDVLNGHRCCRWTQHIDELWLYAGKFLTKLWLWVWMKVCELSIGGLGLFSQLIFTNQTLQTTNFSKARIKDWTFKITLKLL